MRWSYTGEIKKQDLDGGINLYHTLESGQSYCWVGEESNMYQPGQNTQVDWYYNAYRENGEFKLVRVREESRKLEWQSTYSGAEEFLYKALRLDDSLSTIRDESPEDQVVEEAFDRFNGMRIVKDRMFPCIVSFICSSQMRVSRIHQMQKNITIKFGEEKEVEGKTYRSFPRPEKLASASVNELEQCGLGYRADWVSETSSMIADGEVKPCRCESLNFESAREHLKQMTGVGDKVADCILLFSGGFLQSVPLDTWIKTSIQEYFPECNKSSYEETSKAIRSRLGPEYAGYVQTYLFYHLRME